MADKDPNLDNPGMDDELDLPDFDDSMLDGSPGGNRKPIERVAGGFYEGVKRNALSASTRRKVIDNALPKGYGKAYEDAISAVDLGQELYDTARENLVPVQKDLKKIGRYVASKTGSILPDSIQKKLEELTAPEDRSADVLEKTDEDQLAMQAGIEDVFGDFMAGQSAAHRKAQANRLKGDVKTRNILGAQLDLQHRRDQRDEETKMREEVVGEARYRSETNLLNMMRAGVERLVDYQDRITASYQRKSLELQYRQFFVARDHYTLFQSFVKQNDSHLDAITNNTSLPDFLKIRTTESAQAMLRERALGNIGGMIQKKTKGLGQNLKDRVSGLAQSFAEGIRGAADGVDMAEMMDDMPVDKLREGSAAVGDVATGGAMGALAKRLGIRLGKNETIARVGGNLEYLSDNKSEILRDRLMEMRDQDYRDGFGGLMDAGKSSFAEMILGLMPGQSPEVTYGRDASELAEEAGVYTSLADKSITEIIPGLLTDLLHEAEMIRTGDETVDRRVYDFETGEVRRQAEVQKSLVKKALPEGRMESIRDDLMKIVDKLDPDGNLSDSARMAFTRQLLTDASRGRRFDPQRFFSPTGLPEVEDDNDLAAIQQVIMARFLREDGKFREYDKNAVSLRRETSKTFNSARDDIPNYQEVIGRMTPLYGNRTLREAGLVTQEDRAGETRAATENILDYINTGEEPTFSPGQGVPTDEVSEVRRRFGSPADQSDQTPRRDGAGGDADIDRGGLDRVVGLLDRLVEVQRSVDLKRQFANVLDAIAKINPLEHLELNGQWLKDIYELLKNSLGGPDGPSGGPSGPQGGPPTDFSQSRWSRPVPQFGAAPKQQRSRWIRGQADSLRENMESLKVSGVASMSSYRQRLSDQRERFSEGAQGLRMAAGDGIDRMSESARSMGTQIASRSQDAVSELSSRSRESGEDLSKRLSELGQSLSEGTRNAVQSSRAGFGNVQATMGQGKDAMNDPRYTQAVRDVVAYLEGKMPDMDNAKSTLQDMLGRGREMTGTAREYSAGMMSKLNERTQQASSLSQEFIGKIVDRVQDRMAATESPIQTGGSGGDGTGSESGTGDYWTRARELIQEILTHMDRKTEQLQESLENLTLAQMAGDSDEPSALKRLGRGAASGLGGIMSFYGGIWKSVGNVASGGTGMLKNLTGKMFQGRGEQGDGIRDIYIQGHRRPALLARDLRAGRYFDQESGDVVQRLDEITGPVIDSNGDVVISEYDIQEGLLVDGQGKSMMDRLGGIASGFTSYMTSPWRMAFGAGRKILDVGKNWMNKPRDIYVKGEERPRLLAVVMKNGGYLSQATGKVIRSIKDIDGAVVDRQGNVVLTLEDMRYGLTDNRGKAIKGLLRGAKNLTVGAAKGIGNYLTGSYKAMGRGLKGAANLVTGRGGEGRSGSGDGGKKQIELLQDIRDMLDERLEKPLRKGGWRSQLYGDEPKALPAPSSKAGRKAAGAAAAGGGLTGLLKKMFGGDDDGGFGMDVGMDMDFERGDRDDDDRRRRRNKRPKGRMGRMWQGIKSLGGKAIRGIGSAARFAIPAAATAAPAIASAAGTVASGAGSLLAGLGSAIAGVVSAPVVLAGAAVAAVGAGAYFAYKHFSRKPDGPLHRVRLAQYGADPDNKEHVGKISGLEEAMSEEVQFDGKRLASLGSGIDLEEVMEDFGVDLEDEVAVNRWLVWFQQRFKPVYLSHALVAKDMIDETDLTETEDMDDDRKRTYLRRTQFTGDQKPYGNVSPFEDMDSLAGEAKVRLELTNALAKLPAPTKAQQMEEAAEAEVERSNGRTPTPMPDVGMVPDVRQMKKTVLAPVRSGANGRPARGVQRPTQMAAASSAQAMMTTPTPEVGSQPTSTTEAKAKQDRQVAESKASERAQQSQTSADMEAAASVENQRARQEKVARQTAVQSAAASNRVVSEMQRVASILASSHQTQKSMDKSLKNIDAYFQKVQQTETEQRRASDNDRSVRDQRVSDGGDQSPPAAVVGLSR